jgi:hypothetical protein
VRDWKFKIRRPHPRALKDPEQYGISVYDAVQPFAYVIKVLLQMALGAAAVVGLAKVVICGWSPRFIADTTTVKAHAAAKAVRPAVEIHLSVAHLCLGVVGTALVVAAGLELAYTLYTQGPDEAVDPLILALAAALILQLARADHLDQHQAFAMLLYALALAGLFALRHFVDERKNESGRAKAAPDADPSVSAT